MKQKRRLVCVIHAEIETLLDEIAGINFKKLTIEEVLGKEKEIEEKCELLKELVKEANEGAQAMEDRLRDYYDTITGIGFIRKTR